MKTKVLLVENDIPVHAALNGVLRREGYDVINAFDTDEAMVCLQTHPGIDLVLLGLCVPVESPRYVISPSACANQAQRPARPPRSVFFPQTPPTKTHTHAP